jgi:tetratricopeptide (TPR) repeat protein
MVITSKNFTSKDLRDRAAMRKLATFKLVGPGSSSTQSSSIEKDQHARPNKSRSEMIEMFVHRILYQNQQPASSSAKTQTRSGQQRPCCRKTIAELEPISLNEMLVNKLHTGKYLLCRTISKPILTTEMCVLVEDMGGHCEEVSITSAGFDLSTKPEVLLPVHSILIIKEPFLKGINFLSDIKVDSPSDFLVLSDLDRATAEFKLLEHVPKKWLNAIHPPETFEELHKLGNASFASKDYVQAVRFYTRELNSKACVGEVDRKKALSNRAAAFLRLEKFARAYEDTRRAEEFKGVSSSSLNEKVYFRMGEALYAMRQWERALAAFNKCLELNEKCEEARDRVEKTRRRINESLSGMYNVSEVIEAARNRFVSRLDVADFMSNEVEIVPIKGDSNNLGKFDCLFLFK